MIRAAKTPWFERWFSKTVEQRIRKSFESVEVEGLDELDRLARERPVLAVANHTSWWDPMMILTLSRRILDLDAFALMDAKNLVRHRFFALVGAFGVDRGSRRSGAAAIREAVRLLDRPGRVVWLFPQGEERPAHEPLRFEPGAARIAQLTPEAAVVPVGLRYVLGGTPRPRAVVSVGPAIVFDPASGREDMARVLVGGVETRLKRIDEHLLQPRPSFREVLTHRPSRFEAALTRLLDVMAGWWLGLRTRTLEESVSPALPEQDDDSKAPAPRSDADPRVV